MKLILKLLQMVGKLGLLGNLVQRAELMEIWEM
jgi:hypothetical protein